MPIVTLDDQTGEQVDVASYARQLTPPDAVFLTSPKLGEFRLLAQRAAGEIESALAFDQGVRQWLARVRFLRHQLPTLALPAFGDDELRALLPMLCSGKRSLAELRREPLLPWLTALLDEVQRAALSREAPRRLTVPTGAQISLEYRRPDEPPVLASAKSTVANPALRMRRVVKVSDSVAKLSASNSSNRAATPISPSIDWAIDLARTVFPVPGTSSSSRWPSAKRHTRAIAT